MGGTCTERERGNYPQRGTLHKKGGRVGGPAQREGGRPAQREREGTTHRGGSCTKRGVDRPAQREGDLHRERERELPTEGDPAQRGG